MRTTQSVQKQNNTRSKEVLFYSVVTAFGIGLTTLCVYGYRRYLGNRDQQYESSDLTQEDNVSDFYKEVDIEIEDISPLVAGEVNYPEYNYGN